MFLLQRSSQSARSLPIHSPISRGAGAMNEAFLRGHGLLSSNGQKVGLLGVRTRVDSNVQLSPPLSFDFLSSLRFPLTTSFYCPPPIVTEAWSKERKFEASYCTLPLNQGEVCSSTGPTKASATFGCGLGRPVILDRPSAAAFDEVVKSCPIPFLGCSAK